MLRQSEKQTNRFPALLAFGILGPFFDQAIAAATFVSRQSSGKRDTSSERMPPRPPLRLTQYARRPYLAHLPPTLEIGPAVFIGLKKEVTGV